MSFYQSLLLKSCGFRKASMNKEDLILEKILKLLKFILENDKYLMKQLYETRFRCNKKTAEHKDLKVRSHGKENDQFSINIIGLFNGLLDTREDGFGRLCVEVEDGEIVGVIETPIFKKG